MAMKTFAMGFVCLAAFGLAPGDAGTSEAEVGRIEINACPAAVRRTLERESRSGAILEIEKEEAAGKTYYEAEVKIGARQYDVLVSADGVLLRKSLDQLDDAPGDAKVDEDDGDETNDDATEQSAAANKDADDEDGDGDRDDEDGDDGEDDDADEVEVEVKFSDCPAAVQATLKRESTSGKILEIERTGARPQAPYEADIQIDGHVYEVEIDANGVLVQKVLDNEDGEDEDDREIER